MLPAEVFTSVKMAEADKGTASRPMAERLLASAMQMALDSDSIDGVVIDPWTSSATLDCSLLNGLLHASHDTDEPGEAELRKPATVPWPEERYGCALHYYQLSAERLRREPCHDGRDALRGPGLPQGPAQARKFWKKAADAGDVAAWWRWATMPWCGKRGRCGSAEPTAEAQKLCASTPTSPICRRSPAGGPI